MARKDSRARRSFDVSVMFATGILFVGVTIWVPVLGPFCFECE